MGASRQFVLFLADIYKYTAEGIWRLAANG